MANFGGVGGNPLRIIHGREIVYGLRSKYDAKSWECGCKRVNDPIRFLLFDLAAWRCYGCAAPFTGNVDFCIADIMVNGMALIQKIKNQGEEPECIPYAIAHLVEIIQRFESILKKEYLGIFSPNIVPMRLAQVYTRECPMMCTKNPVYHHVGLHKFLYLAQHIRNVGISLKTGKRIRIETMSTIPIHDYEWICEEIADGNPLLVNFYPGQKFWGLEYCKMYKSVGPAKIAANPNGEYVGHMAVLVGGISIGAEKGFWVLNSHSELWCPKFGVPSIPKSLIPNFDGVFKKKLGPSQGGIFKLNIDNIVWNAIKFSRSDDSEPLGTIIRNENLYIKAAPGSGECDRAAVSDFLYDAVAGSHFDRRLSADEKEEKTLNLFNHLPFCGLTATSRPQFISGRIEAKRTLEALQSLPFRLHS